MGPTAARPSGPYSSRCMYRLRRDGRDADGSVLRALVVPEAIRLHTLARQAQVPDWIIQAIVGHHGDAMTERYDRVEVQERKLAVGQVIEFAGLATKVGG